MVFKTGRNSIMLKGNTAIDFSESIITSDNKIENQSEYILNLFKSKFDSYKNKQKSNIDQIIRIMNRLSISELEKISEILKDRIKENFSFDLEAGSELDF